MSYRSRVYRQRNLHTHDEGPNEAFFGKQHDRGKQSRNGNFFQTRLAISTPGDKFENEADAVANRVSESKANKAVIQQRDISAVQRQSANEEEMRLPDTATERKEEVQPKPDAVTGEEKEKEEIRRKSDEMKEEEKKKTVQKQEAGIKEEEKKKVVQKKSAVSPSRSVLKTSIQDTSKGSQLPRTALSEMNTAFGRDFSQIRVHADAEAARMSTALNAQAFTHKADIYFNHGKFQPDSQAGRRLLAHELTHTIQQTGADVPHKTTTSAPSPETLMKTGTDNPRRDKPETD